MKSALTHLPVWARRSPLRHWLLLASLSSSLALAEVRMWTDVSGRKVEAELVMMQGEFVYLKTQDGKTHPFPLTRLSAEDIALARRLSPPAPSGVAAARPANLTPEQAAERLDRVVEAHLKAKGIKPNPPLNDEQFVRRLYLQTVGRIPKYEEAMAFIADKDRNKRAKLTDKLLASPGHTSHLFNYYADMLRLKTRVSEYISGAGYNRWVKQAVAENKPYDVMVREMMTASGNTQTNPAAGYLLRDSGMLLDNLSVTSQVFLGTDISCAQCHDHPFDDWTQKQFYHLAAYFGSTRTAPDYGMLKQGLADRGLAWRDNLTMVAEADKFQAIDPLVKPAVQRFLHASAHHITENPKSVMKLPHDYQYKDGMPGEVVEPKVLFGNAPDLTKFDNRRAAFAHWLTADDNPRFAVTIANRLWKRAFGRAVVEPVTDVNDLSTAAIPGLVQLLGEEMKRLRYDIREFERLLYRTRAWQRESSLASIAPGASYDFPGPLLRRLTAEQIWDSVLTLILDDPDYFNGQRDYTEWEKLYSMDRGTVTGKELTERYAKLVELSSKDGGLYGWPREDESMRPSGSPLYIDPRIKAWRLYGDVLVRASEITQPTGGGHLLRNLGQSDRELVDASVMTGSVPISLALMNGRGSQVITKPGSRLMNVVDQHKADGPKVEAVFLSILSRLPSPDERSAAYKTIRQGGKNGFADVAWALLNTREFLFVQ